MSFLKTSFTLAAATVTEGYVAANNWNFFRPLVQRTAKVTGHSRLAASLNEP